MDITTGLRLISTLKRGNSNSPRSETRDVEHRKVGLGYLSSAELKAGLRGGVRDELRGCTWSCLAFLRSQAQSPSLTELTADRSAAYKRALEAATQSGADTTEILNDVFRTFPTIQYYTRLYDGQGALQRLMLACSQECKGYCQGMAYIGGHILLYMKEEDAFWLFQVAVKHYGLSGYYDREFLLLKQHMRMLTVIVQKFVPKVGKHLESLRIDAGMFASQWFITLFTHSSLPRQLSQRVWDIFLAEGNKIFFRVTAAILELLQAQLVGLAFDDSLSLLQNSVTSLNSDEIIKAALRLKITYSYLQSIR